MLGRIGTLLFFLCALLVAGHHPSDASPLRAIPADVVTPDPALLAYVANLHDLAARAAAAQSRPARAAGFAAVEALIAPKLVGFSGSLDPLQPWKRVEPEGRGLVALAAYMIEQGDSPVGTPGAPDYRVDMARLVAEMAGFTPIVLLDEVAAHLDPERRAALYDALEGLGTQVWMTGADPQAFSGLTGRADIFAVSGNSLTRT